MSSADVKGLRQYDFRTSLAGCWNNVGTVYLAQNRSNGEFCCIKKYPFDKCRDEVKHIKEEILMMRHFKHGNILQIHSSFVFSLDVYVVTPVMCYGSCKDTLNNCFKSGFPEAIAVLILRDLLNALDYLHKKNFIHRSIRASHILLDENRAVLTGFRDCISLVSHGERVKRFHTLPENSVKSINWLAPELLEQNLLGYNEKSDVYSVGVTICELCNGIEPFSDMKTTLMMIEKIRGNQPSLLDFSTCPDEENIIIDQSADPEDLRLALEARQIYSSKHFSDNIHKFAETCMLLNPTERPSTAQLLGHPLFKQVRHTSLQEQLSIFGIQAVNFSSISDSNLELELTGAMMEMDMGGSTIEWDF